jgi:thiamine kinase-like enzyme
MSSIIKTISEKGYTISKLKQVTTDIRSFVFQCYLYEHINNKGGFRICKPLSITSAGKLLSLNYEYIDSEKLELNQRNVFMLGRYTSMLHVFCKKNEQEFNLPVKAIREDFEEWDTLNKPLIQASLELRIKISKQLNSEYDFSQPFIPLHRDLKLRNIIYSADNFYLIDFDFAAKDDLSIELASFIVDILFETRDFNLIKSFIKGYKSANTLDINWSTVINNYLKYLCFNTFPFYLKQNFTESEFNNLLTERNEKLIYTFKNKKQLDEIIQRSFIC